MAIHTIRPGDRVQRDEPSPLLDERRLKVAIQDWAVQSGIRLRERRTVLRWSQETLGELVGVRATAISKFELGIAVPKDSVRICIACALMCEVNDIWAPLDRNYALLVARPAA